MHFALNKDTAIQLIFQQRACRIVVLLQEPEKRRHHQPRERPQRLPRGPERLHRDCE